MTCLPDEPIGGEEADRAREDEDEEGEEGAVAKVEDDGADPGHLELRDIVDGRVEEDVD